jgi:hypothetical protein
MAATLTPYACAKIVNDELKKDGFDKKLPPQMIYTYVRKAYIPSTMVDGKRKVDLVDLQKWYKGYVEKQKAKTEESTNEVVPDNDGTIAEWSEVA